MTEVPTPGRLFAGPLLVWLVGGLVAAAAIGWTSVRIQQAGFAPVGLHSLGVGLTLGGALVLLAQAAGHGHRPILLVGAFFVALLAAIVQHGVVYARYRADFSRQLASLPLAAPGAGAAELQPHSFVEYVRLQGAGPAAWMWLLDVGLIAAATVGVVAAALRRPYCNRCRNWYRTNRHGRLSGTALSAAARELGPPAAADSASYRLSTCPEGCGPARLEVTWNSADRSDRSVTWLSSAEWRRIDAILDTSGKAALNDE